MGGNHVLFEERQKKIGMGKKIHIDGIWYDQ